jgi:hypothetical protein
MPVTIEKKCVICGKDVSTEKRTKDARGNYYCEPCRLARIEAIRASGAPQPAAAPAEPTALNAVAPPPPPHISAPIASPALTVTGTTVAGPGDVVTLAATIPPAMRRNAVIAAVLSFTWAGLVLLMSVVAIAAGYPVGIWNALIAVLYIAIGVGLLRPGKKAYLWAVGSNCLNLVFSVLQLVPLLVSHTNMVAIAFEIVLLALEGLILFFVLRSRKRRPSTMSALARFSRGGVAGLISEEFCGPSLQDGITGANAKQKWRRMLIIAGITIAAFAALIAVIGLSIHP